MDVAVCPHELIMRVCANRLLLVSIACALASAVVLTQEPKPAPPGQQKPQPQDQTQKPADPPEQPIFRAKVNLVRVDVTVMDRDGEPLQNLEPSDFQVKEDGVLQTVETVQFVRLSGTPPANLRESIAIRSQEHAAAEAAKEDVRLFVLFLDDYHVDKAPQVMIPLRRTLKAFVDKLGPYDLVAVMDPLTPLTHLQFTRDRSRVMEIVQKFEGRRGELFPVRSAAEEAQQSQRNIWELRAGVTLDALNAVATHLGGLREGRKSILFVSQGPLVSLRSVNWPRMEEVVESANRGNVTIHTLDPRPLGSSEFGGNFVLRRFSDETGGRAIFNTNDHAEHLDAVFKDASAYYLVGYAPTREMADGKFHKIDVEVKRPRVRVVARRGYWAPRAEELNAPVVEPVAPAVMSALSGLVVPRAGRTAEIWVGYSRGAAEPNTAVTVTWEPTSRMGTAAASRIDIEWLRPDGTADGPAQSVPKKDAVTTPATAKFDLKPGKNTLRFTSFDAQGEVLDRWPEDLIVPPMNGALALATPRLYLARSAFELRAVQSTPNIAPAATRRVRKTDRLVVELEYYSSAGTPELVAELLNQKGESLVTLPVPEPVGNKVRFELPLQSLATSVYVLKIQARTADKQVAQHVPFRIVP
jgi:VWFA-related protein